MHVFSGKTINCVYLSALKDFRKNDAILSNSRAGTVLDLGPAYFEFTAPTDQLLTLRNRNYNPYFAIIEACWILNGDNSLENLEKVIASYGKYSDDGKSLNGAYGYRIKSHFKIDQLESAVQLLSTDPLSRRAVLTLYSPNDLDNNSSFDIPCNISICLKIRQGELDITVFNRSNDIFLGIPYNIFVFSILQKYIAARLGVKTGVQRHFTDSLHLYERNISTVDEILESNNQGEIDRWDGLRSPTYLYSCMISEFEKISNLRFNDINCNQTRAALKNYSNLHQNESDIDFRRNLPYDILGISSYLWTTANKST